MESFLSDRTAGLAFDGEIEEMSPVQTGIPQGSPVSPILFLLYRSPLFDELERKHPEARCPSYIDDLGLLVVGKSAIANCQTLQWMATTVVDCQARNALKFDDPKTELMHFHQKRGAAPDAIV